MTPTLTLQLPTFAAYGRWLSDDWRRLLDLAQRAEDAGVDRITYVDHVVMGAHPEQYEWGNFALPPEVPWLECLTVLAAVAAVTSTVRLSTRILIAPLRPAALLAKTAATIDQLSGGRLDLGVGTGWQREEFDAEGLDFERRGQLLTDTITACRALWTETPASVTTPSISFEGIYCEPKPAQHRLPVWFGGVLHPRNVRRIVELGDGWIPIMTATVDDVAAGARRLREEAERSARGPYDVLAAVPVARSDEGVPDLARTMAAVPKLVEAGATDLHVSLSAVCRNPERARDAIPEIVRQFRSAT